ncbi:MAG: alpha-glucuronidase [Ignavibacteria bacterium GWC2_36_12]|nr:MAG: alpha-glucuronidase [Ignavibacteria bacterium GWC2_36_12]
MKKNTLTFILSLFLLCNSNLKAEDGYRLWLRYDLISNQERLNEYKELIKGCLIEGNSSTINAVENELQIGLKGLLGSDIPPIKSIGKDGILIASKYSASYLLSKLKLETKLKNIGSEGFLIFNSKIEGKKVIVITANEDVGILYGVFNFLRLLQRNQDISNLNIESSPKIKLRLLNHWDNLDRTVERGYAGFSIWDWHRLPEYIDPKYKDYARANASIGINGTVLTNVNANALVLTSEYLEKVKSLADVFHPYGIKVYLTARFSAPVEIGGLKTADPFDKDVQQWWRDKAKEIYSFIPDFGGFLVKANSEGQPGPQNYGRSHVDGANMLADALQPFGGVVMWRAFVYDNNVPEDRAKQAYNEFKPFDGKFRNNVLIQAKNGPIDFQPREPFHPLFGALQETPLMMEFQITQEYLGQASHLVYLAPLYKECLESDTYAKGNGSTVARIIDGSLDNHSLTGIAGVSNIGTDRNWTGHLFGQANWFAYGRLSWNHKLSSEEIADEWIGMTFSNDLNIIKPIKTIMMNSREITVNYMTPLGLHHIMGWSHHYGPAPWIKDKNRADWTSVYYHRADSNGIGFNRTSTGSNAVSQYFPPVAEKFSSLQTCPDEYLLWFHHLPWDYKVESGNTLWEELCYHYYNGVESVKKMQTTWNSLEDKIDKEVFNHVKMLLTRQEKEAVWWRNACVLYFQTFSKQPIPEELEMPDKSLEYYESLNFPYAPGI